VAIGIGAEGSLGIGARDMWSLWPADRRRRTGRGFRAAIASTLVPGVGQLLLGRRLKATCCLVVTAIVVGLIAWLGMQEPATLAAWAVTPEVLVGVFVGNVGLLAFRLFATFDAYADGARPAAAPVMPRRSTARVGVATAWFALAGAVIAPHAVIGYVTATTHGVLHRVFAGEDDHTVSAARTHQPADGAVDVRDDGDASSGSAGSAERAPRASDGLPEDTAPAYAEPPLSPDNPWMDAGRITVALLGSDGGPGRDGDRIDSLLVVTVATETGEAAVFSVDRYLADFPVPDRIADVYEEHCLDGEGWVYLNALYRCGNERVPEAFAAAYPHADDPAAAAVTEVLGDVLGIAVPHYAMVDMAGFVAIVDALGGVDVDLAAPLQVRMSPPSGREWVTVDLPAGRQVVDGEEALAFVRIREAEGGDADRMRRQRCLVTSVVDRADIGAIVRGFPDLAAAVEDHVTTSVPLRALPSLIEVLASVDAEGIITVGFGPPDYRGWDHRPDLPRIQERVREVLADPESAREAGTSTEVGEDVCR
jgi:LCP family protein required for cell wall assembly